MFKLKKQKHNMIYWSD